MTKQTRHRRGDRLHLAGLVHQHEHARRVVDQRAKSPHVVGGHLPAAALGQVTYRHHDTADVGVVEEAAADHLDETPPFRGAHPQLERRADVFALDAGQRHHGKLVVARVHEIEHADADHVLEAQLEERFGSVVGPNEPGGVVDYDRGVGKTTGDLR